MIATAWAQLTDDTFRRLQTDRVKEGVRCYFNQQAQFSVSMNMVSELRFFFENFINITQKEVKLNLRTKLFIIYFSIQEGSKEEQRKDSIYYFDFSCLNVVAIILLKRIIELNL